MARITFSPIMVDARGKVGDCVFSCWKGINYIRSRVVPSNPQSDLQTAQRNALKYTLTMWQSIKSWAKKHWDTYASGYSMSGYNRYMDHNILHTKAGTAGKITPYDKDYIIIGTMAAAAGGSGEITCTWANLAGASGRDSILNYYRKTEALSEEYAWTEGTPWDVLTLTGTISGLDAGEEYEIAFFCWANDNHAVQESFNKILTAGS